MISLTYDRRSEHRRNPLEEQQNPKGVCQPVQTQEVHQHHGGQAHVRARGDAEQGTVDGLGGEAQAEVAKGDG